MKAGVITIGSELLRGRTVDSNFIYISRALTRLGVRVEKHITVNDDLTAISSAFEDFANSFDFVVCTGGLGPTFDDLTRQGLSAALNLELEENPVILAGIKHNLASRGIAWQDISARQALLPRGGKALDNPVGIAPGISLEHENGVIFCLPGVPQEFKHLFDNNVLPDIENCCNLNTQYSTLKMVGIPEVEIAQYIETLGEMIDSELAINVENAVITLHFLALSHEGKAACAQAYETIREQFSQYIFATQNISLPQAVGMKLAELGLTIGTVESCTGGLITAFLTDVSGSSGYFSGSVVTYSNGLKEKLGVDAETLSIHGAVSEQTAAQMAQKGKEYLGTDIVISATGIAGPQGGTEEKGVGLVYIGIDGPFGTRVIEKKFGGSRDFNRRATSNVALFLVWEYLTENFG